MQVKEFIRSVDKAKRADMIATTDNLKRTALHLVIK